MRAQSRGRVIDQGPKAVAYSYLEVRPHSWHRQLCLGGRTMTVGQLVATMRADGLNPEQAAGDLDLPLAQIAEVLFYYAGQHDLVDSATSSLQRYRSPAHSTPSTAGATDRQRE